MKQKIETMDCECCGKRLDIKFTTTKYCSSCSVHNHFIGVKLTQTKRELESYKGKYFELKRQIENGKKV